MRLHLEEPESNQPKIEQELCHDHSEMGNDSNEVKPMVGMPMSRPLSI